MLDGAEQHNGVADVRVRASAGTGREGIQDGKVRGPSPGNANGLGFVARRYCALCGRGA